MFVCRSHLIPRWSSTACYFMHYRSCQSPHIPLEDCLIYNPVSAKAKTTIYSVFPLLASAIALTHPFLDGAFLAISLFPEYHPDALILFQSVKLASIKPKNPLLFKTQQLLIRINLEKLVILTYNIVTPLMRERNCNNVYKQRRIRKDVRNN